MKSGSGARYSGYLKMHWSWNVYLALSLFALSAAMFFIDRRAGLICLAFSCAYFLVVLLIYIYYRPKILQALIMFAGRYGEIQGDGDSGRDRGSRGPCFVDEPAAV